MRTLSCCLFDCAPLDLQKRNHGTPIAPAAFVTSTGGQTELERQGESHPLTRIDAIYRNAQRAVQPTLTTHGSRSIRPRQNFEGTAIPLGWNDCRPRSVPLRPKKVLALVKRSIYDVFRPVVLTALWRGGRFIGPLSEVSIDRALASGRRNVDLTQGPRRDRGHRTVVSKALGRSRQRSAAIGKERER